MRRSILTVTIAGALLAGGQSVVSAQPPETADIMSQDSEAVYAADGARLVRQANGIAVSMKMPAPQPGEYTYPDGVEPGHPEVFTLWMFVFNHPDHCVGECGLADISNPNVGFGVYDVAGHANAGASLTLSGRIGVGDPAIAPPGITPHPLSNPAGAEVHLAVTSHGALDPATLPDEFRIPTGSPMCECWWVAIFK